MTTFQKIDSADNLIPNGQFCEGTAYWEEDPNVAYRTMRHIKFFEDHESDSLLLGEPKYGLYAGPGYTDIFGSNTNVPVWCWLNRNDLFTYPIKRFRSGFTAIPIDPMRLMVAKVRADDFKSEAVDWATTYDATLDTKGALSIVIEKSVLIPIGTKVAWLRPDGQSMLLVIDSEGAPGIDYRTFTVHKSDNTPITDSGPNPDIDDGISTINFQVTKIVAAGSTAVVVDAQSVASGYYTVENPSEDEITLVKQGTKLQLKAQTGDVEGVVYEYNVTSPVPTMRLRIFGSLIAKGVSTNDYFVMQRPSRAYGRIASIAAQPDGTEEAYIEIIKGPPETGAGTFVAATDWVVSPRIYCGLELQIPGVQYELTLAFTHYSPPPTPAFNWRVYLDFVTEEGASINARRVIDSLEATWVTRFPVAKDSRGNPSKFYRWILKVSATRPLPIPGLPRLRFQPPPNLAQELRIADVVMVRDNFTSTNYNESLPTDFDEMQYSGSPDGGLIPKGTVIPYIGGRTCPPGWREVIGHPNDTTEQNNSNPPGSVEFVFPEDPPGEWFKFDEISYNPEKDITTLVFSSTTWDLSKDSYSYYPWSAYKVYMPVIMRPPPRPPTYSFRIRINGYSRTVFSIRLPAPPARSQRYEYVEVGMLKPKIPSALMLQVVRNAKNTPAGIFETKKYPFAPDAMYNIMIADVRIMTKFVAFEHGSSADTIHSERLTYPSSYNSLYNEFNIDNAAPTPDGITTLFRLLNELFTQINKIVLYDPRRLGEPLPAIETVRATEANPPLRTEIDLIGDWVEALSYLHGPMGEPPRARIIRTGYAKIDSEAPGLTGLGSEQHNHEVRKSNLEPISGVAVKITGVAPNSVHRPPVPANHGHGYLGAGGYSRPYARAVKFCEKL